MFIGDGAKLVRDAFALAKEKTPAIIFIDELDAIGTKVHNVLVCTAQKNNRAVFKWLSKNQNQSNYSDQSQQEQVARWTNHSS